LSTELRFVLFRFVDREPCWKLECAYYAPGLGGEDIGQRASIRQVAFASFIGTAIESYDFFLFGTAAALVFNQLFFPTFAPLTGTLATFATFGVGFFARPVGGVVFGHFGDHDTRNFYASWPQMGAPAGLVLSTAVFTAFFSR